MAPLRIHRPGFSFFIKALLVLLLLGAIMWYAGFQARFFLAGPTVTLMSPEYVIQETNTIAVQGYAKNITELRLNGKQIHTNEAGYFDETLMLPDGYTIMTLYAKDRYGRTTSLSKDLVFTRL